MDWKYENGDYWFYIKDSGGRWKDGKRDGWFSYKQHLKGDVRQVWICTSLKEQPKPTPTPTPTPTPKKTETYKGDLPKVTIKKGSKGINVTRWQRYLKWFGYTSVEDDGKFGSDTFAKTKLCQKKLGFTGKDVDGVVGKMTIAKAKAYKKQVSP